MDKNKIEQINIKALKLNDSFCIIDNENECVIAHMFDINKNRKKYLEYRQEGKNKVYVNIYDAINDDMKIRKAAEFICSFNADNMLEGFQERTISFTGQIKESRFVKIL